MHIDVSKRFEGGWATKTAKEGDRKILIGIECRKDGIKDLGEPLGEDWHWAKEGYLCLPVTGKGAAVGAYWMGQMSRYFNEIANDPILQNAQRRLYARSGQVFFDNQRIAEVRINCVDDSGLEYNLWAPGGPPFVFNRTDSGTDDLQIAGTIRPNLNMQEESDGYLHPALRVADRGRSHFSFGVFTPPNEPSTSYILALWDLHNDPTSEDLIQQLQDENFELREKLIERKAADQATLETLEIAKRLDPSGLHQAMKTPINWEQISTQIRIAREKRGWSQEALAETADIDRKTVNAIENGRPTNGNTLFSLLNALDGKIIIE